MTVLNIATEAVFLRDAAGRLQPRAGSSGDVQWREAARRFETIRLIARVEEVRSLEGQPALEPGLVRIIPLPRYRGIGELVRALPALLRSLRIASRVDGAFLMRLPGPIGTFLALILALKRRPYAVQLVGDPADVLRAGDFGSCVSSLRWLPVWLTRRAIESARVVNYVTAASLQRRYPASDSAFSFAVSDVALSGDWFAGPRIHPLVDRPRLFFCGSLEQRYKGLDVLIEAVTLLGAQGLLATVNVAGDGIHRGSMQALADERGIGEQVTFLGAVPPDQVRRQLDAATMFVLPSRTEGLPRSLVEAMARGLPSVASNVGGIVELLPAARLVPPDDPVALARAIAELWADPEEYRRESERGFRLAQRFGEDALAPVRTAFYDAVASLASSGLSPEPAAAPR